MFSRRLAAHGHKIREDSVVLLKVQVRVNDDRRSLSVLEVEALRLLQSAPELHLDLPTESIARARIDRLRDILRRHPGESPVFLHLAPDKVLQLGAEFAVDVDRAVPELRVAFGIDVIRPTA